MRRKCWVVAVVATTLLGCQGGPERERPPQSNEPVPAPQARLPPPDSEEGAPTSGAQVFAGTGVLFAPPAQTDTESPTDRSPSDEEVFQLDFIDTEIAQVFAAVLGEGLDLPYTVDPRIKGTMTLQASRALSQSELLGVLEAALRAHGAAIVIHNGVYQLVPNADASRRVSELRVAGSAAQGYGIYVSPLQYISAEEMQKILQPFAQDGAVLRVDTQRNLLLLAGTSQEIATLLNVIRTFDVDWMAGMSFAIYPLEYVDVRTLSAELTEILEKAGGAIGGLVRFVPLGRLNSLLVISPQARYLNEVETWIKRLDRGAATPGRRIYVYDVQNGKADALAASLNKILAISGEAFASGEGRVPNGIGDVTSSRGQSTSVRGAAEASGGELNEALKGNDLKIVPNDENNSLLVLANPSEFQVIESALHRLDTVPIQVLIEASIAEVTLTDDIRYGLQWLYQWDKGPISLSESGSGTINQQFPGFSYLYNLRSDIRAVLNAIESLTSVRVLSAPKLMVLNNREATLQVGDQVPISTQSAVSTQDGDSPIVNSIQLRDTGVILRVTPRVNRTGRIVLEVAQEVSDAARNTVSGIDSPSIAQRKISTTVSMQHGETVALGGLIRESKGSGGSGIPYLRKVPVFGQLFGSTNRATRRTELIVLITPRVIQSGADLDRTMSDLEDQFRTLRSVLPAWRASGPEVNGGASKPTRD